MTRLSVFPLRPRGPNLLLDDRLIERQFVHSRQLVGGRKQALDLAPPQLSHHQSGNNLRRQETCSVCLLQQIWWQIYGQVDSSHH